MQGILFPQAFLEEGIKETESWLELPDAEWETFAQAARKIFSDFPTNGKPNEAQTESDLILPLIEALGWHDYLPQQTISRRGRTDVPDALLFAGPEEKAAANLESDQAAR
jgi:hypothetical protein